MKKNGFTLIELLAVIVILAIIAVIATPIILGIVENTRKEAFQRSVELVEKATSLNVNNKTYETNYTYTLTDGVISDDVKVANTEGMNGTISYDKDGNVIYAIYNDKWCVVKEKEITITNYVEGECRLPGTFTIVYNLNGGINEIDAVTIFTMETETFSLPTPTKDGSEFKGWYLTSDFTGETVTEIPKGTKEDKVYYAKWEFKKLAGNLLNSIKNAVYNIDDLVETGDGQLVNLGEYGIRYQGTDPNNYVEFNNETWRIIGIVDGKVKLVRDKIDLMPLNDQDKDGKYDQGIDINDWSNSTLKARLNGTYYDSLINKDMIDTTIWHLRGYNMIDYIDKYEMYGIERGTEPLEGIILHNTPTIEQNIGLMYPSDYGFAAKHTDTCLSTTDLLEYQPCKATNWLTSEQFVWTLNSNSSFEYRVFVIYPDGFVCDYDYVNLTIGVRPALYLRTDVKVIGDGDGSMRNRYQLAI